MGLFQKLFTFALVPLIAFFTLREYSPDTLALLENAIHPHIVNTPLASLLTPQLPLPHETPLLFSSITHQSHVEKIAAMAVAVASLGYRITFITGRVFAPFISSLHPNISFVPFHGLDDKLSEEDLAHWMSLASGVDREIFITKKVLVDNVDDMHDTYQDYFREFREKHGDSKPLISFYDSSITGHLAVLQGVPGIKPDASIGVSMFPLLLDSVDTYPTRTGKKPAQGEDARELHKKAYEERADRYNWEVSYAWWNKLRAMGSTQDEFPSILDGFCRVPDYLLTMGVPEFEFPRSDLRSNVRYFGAIETAKKEDEKELELPAWWGEMLKAKREGKKILAVSQGTVETKPEELTLPVLEALAGRDDVFVVATFYNVEPEEVEALVVPENARVAKYIPHEELFPYVDIAISNGGYGMVQKSLRRGIPMIISGEGQDKADVAAIVDYTGVGINLGRRISGEEKIREAVEKMLSDKSYGQRAAEMAKKYDGYDMRSVFESVVKDVMRDWLRRKGKEV